jgi:hypothetical protein
LFCAIQDAAEAEGAFVPDASQPAIPIPDVQTLRDQAVASIRSLITEGGEEDVDRVREAKRLLHEDYGAGDPQLSQEELMDGWSQHTATTGVTNFICPCDNGYVRPLPSR